jgi:hypothetical protein
MAVTVRAIYNNLGVLAPQTENGPNLLGRIDLTRFATAPNDLAATLPVAFGLTANILNAANAGDFTFRVIANPPAIPADFTLTGAQVLSSGLVFPAGISSVAVFVFTFDDTLFEGGALATPEVLALDLLPVAGSYDIDNNIQNTFLVGQIIDNEIRSSIL